MKKVFNCLFYFLFMMITTIAISQEQSGKCDFCHSEITGKFYMYRTPAGDGVMICEECYNDSNKCEVCKAPLKSSVDKFKGHYLCDICRESAPFCGLCGNLIVGKYTIGSKYKVCEECAETKPKCSLCRVPVNPPKTWDGKTKLLCLECSKDAKYCSICNELIGGGYTKYEDPVRLVCDKCMKSLPKCDSCMTPMSATDVNKVRNKKICNACMKKLDKCPTCGLPTVGKQYTFKYAEGKFCDYCIKHRPPCDICQRPIGDEIALFPDGRKLCQECNKSVVKSKREVLEIHKEITEFFEKEMNMKIAEMPALEIVDSKTLQGFFGKKGTWSTTAELGAFRVVNNEKGIFILDSLPRSLVYESVAHETAHVFQFEQNPDLDNKEIIEGFAQWAASKVLEKKGYYPELDKLKDRTDLYGDGFRLLYEHELRYGKDAVFEKVKSEK